MAVADMIKFCQVKHKIVCKEESRTKTIVLADFRPEGWFHPQISFPGTDNNQTKAINTYLSSLAPELVTPEKNKTVRLCDGFVG